jgi:tRNA threonylcarbamoyladenosine biosynthesis protein TsaB
MNKDIKIMAIETSGRLGSVALALGPQLLAEQAFTSELQHAAQLLPTMETLCRQQNWQPCDIEHLYISAGPGSFTGVRIAITVAKTIAYAQQTKIVAVPSIEPQVLNADLAIQNEKLPIKHLAVVLEAGLGQIFTAIFEKTPSRTPPGGFLPKFRVVTEQTRMNPDQLLAATSRPLYLLGQGLSYHASELSGDGIIWLDQKYWQPRAANIHRCGWLRAHAGLFADPDQLVPIYLRRPEAVEKWEKLHGKNDDNLSVKRML